MKGPGHEPLAPSSGAKHNGTDARSEGGRPDVADLHHTQRPFHRSLLPELPPHWRLTAAGEGSPRGATAQERRGRVIYHHRSTHAAPLRDERGCGGPSITVRLDSAP